MDSTYTQRLGKKSKCNMFIKSVADMKTNMTLMNASIFLSYGVNKLVVFLRAFDFQRLVRLFTIHNIPILELSTRLI